MKKFTATMIQADINVLQTGNKNGTHDIAKIDVVVQLAQPLQQQETFIFPNEEGSESVKIYLPNGEKVEIGDFDGATPEQIEESKAAAQQLLNSFLEAPGMDPLKQLVDVLEDYWEFKIAGKQVVVPAGEQLLTFSYTRRVPKNESGAYELKTIVPLPNFELPNAGGARASLTVNLPFDVPVSNIVKSTWTPINGAEQELTRTEIAGGRVILVGYWQYDPLVHVIYRR